MERLNVLFGIALTCLFAGSAIGQFDNVDSGDYTFSVSQHQLPWAQALDACVDIGQRLLSVESTQKDDMLVELFVEQRDNNVTLHGNTWIAANEIREGVWQWATTGKPLYRSRWFMDGQPDDTENLNCVYLASQYLLYWRDANCSAPMYFICEGQRQQKINEIKLE